MTSTNSLDLHAQFAAAMAASAATNLGARDNPNAQNGAGEPNADLPMQTYAPGAKTAHNPFKAVSSDSLDAAPQLDVVMAEGNPVDLAAQAAAFDAHTATEANNARLKGELATMLAEAEPGRIKVRVLKAGAQAPYMWPVTDYPLPEVATPTNAALPSHVKMRLECDATRLRCMVQGLQVRALAAETVRKRGPKAIPTITPLQVQLFYKNLVGEMGTLDFLEECLHRYLSTHCAAALVDACEGSSLLDSNVFLPLYTLHGGPVEYWWAQGCTALRASVPKLILSDSI